VQGGAATQNLRFRDFPTAAQVEGYAAHKAPRRVPRAMALFTFCLAHALKGVQVDQLAVHPEVIEWIGAI